jgi:hypothetical protein
MLELRCCLVIRIKCLGWNHLIGISMVRVWDQEVYSSMISSSSLVVANMMTTGGLHDR